MTVRERIEELRAYMEAEGIDAVLVLTEDPHQSEYVAGHYRLREYFSGFDGSAGHLVVGLDWAGLWTDPRYHLAAETALAGTPITLFRAPDSRLDPVARHLAGVLSPGAVVGVDGRCLSMRRAGSLRAVLAGHGIELRVDVDPGVVWKERPPLPARPVWEPATDLGDGGRKSRLQRIREAMAEARATHHFLASLDDIAWVLGLRGSDVEFNPLFLAFLMIGPDSVCLYTDASRLSAEVAGAISADGVRVAGYHAALDDLRRLPDGATVLMDPERVGAAYRPDHSGRVKVAEAMNPSTVMKACKSESQLSMLGEAMIRDGVIMVRFLKWIEEQAGSGIDEFEAGAYLDDLRRRAERALGPSFSTICGFGANGAIVHYAAARDSAAAIAAEGVLLVDSGGHYLDGTTDITRTIVLGPADPVVARDYTLVLKGHIALARAVFPAGTRGEHLDVLARFALWQEGLNYGHGTGHGVGFVLPVHEGPQRIALLPTEIDLRPGMVISNEPGLYRAGSHGIRIENLVVVEPARRTDFAQFYRFRTLTLCPIGTRPILKELMTEEERDWVDAYHREVRRTLMPHLDDDERSWLEERTRPL